MKTNEMSPSIERKSDAEYLKLLGERLLALQNELAITEAQRKEVAGTGIDSADEYGDRQNELQTLEETIDGSRKQIEEVVKAIRWAEKHGFICAVCNKEIETKRLNVDNASITCIEHMGQEDDIEV